jgi:hypothetical protein
LGLSTDPLEATIAKVRHSFTRRTWLKTPSEKQRTAWFKPTKICADNSKLNGANGSSSKDSVKDIQIRPAGVVFAACLLIKDF